MKEKDDIATSESIKSNSDSKETQEQARNKELWARDVDQPRGHSSDNFKDTNKDSGETDAPKLNSKENTNDTRDLSVHEGAPTAEKIGSMIEKAWADRESPGRFDTEGKSAVLWSGYSTSSDHRKESLGKDGPIYSKELADHHTSINPDTHITLGQTKGGQELEKIQELIDSDFVNESEREALNKQITTLWTDASQRFAESGSKNGSSIAYVEHSRSNSVYKETERKTIEASKEHRHFTDKPLEDGRPPKEDKTLRGDLDRDGRYYTT
jgi:hypothetical protein